MPNPPDWAVMLIWVVGMTAALALSARVVFSRKDESTFAEFLAAAVALLLGIGAVVTVSLLLLFSE